jgi:hypothetical protein
VTDAHRAYLLALKERGLLLVSGPLNPRHGGVLLLRVPDEGARETLDRIRDEDPTPKPEWRSTSCCHGRRTLAPKGWSGCRAANRHPEERSDEGPCPRMAPAISGQGPSLRSG